MITIQKLNENVITHGKCRSRHRGGPQIILLNYGKRTDFWHLVLLGENILSKESPPSIMVTRNPNWSTEILWYGTGYVKGKIISPLKRSAWGRLHCWFCLKLLNFLLVYVLMIYSQYSWLWRQWIFNYG